MSHVPTGEVSSVSSSKISIKLIWIENFWHRLTATTIHSLLHIDIRNIPLLHLWACAETSFWEPRAPSWKFSLHLVHGAKRILGNDSAKPPRSVPPIPGLIHSRPTPLYKLYLDSFLFLGLEALFCLANYKQPRKQCRSPRDSSVHDTVWMTVISASERYCFYRL